MNRNHVFDSTGPDMRLRGTAQQLFEKYLQLGRDATSGGDRVMAEGYFQHAEHYFRILNAMSQAQQAAPAQQQQGHQRGRYQGPEQGGEMQGQEGGSAEQPEFGSQGGSNLEAELEAEVQQLHAEPRDREPRDRDREARERDMRDRDNRERDQG